MDIDPKIDIWLSQVSEAVVDPGRPIIDAHHHLASSESLWKETCSGHNIEKTVYVECGAGYYDSGPEHLMSVGETALIANMAVECSGVKGKADISAIVGHADLTLSERLLAEALDAHQEAGSGLFRGIRHGGGHHPHPEEALFPGPHPADLFLGEAFQNGVRLLGTRGLSFEAWLYHFQIPDFLAVARAAPETTVILNHFGSPLGTKSYNDREAVYVEWQQNIRQAASYPNVIVKLGGLAWPDGGFGWHEAELPPTSDDIVSAHKRYYLHVIDAFGVERCMFESNFPVDKFSVSYPVLWNAFKKMTADFSEDEKSALFYDTAYKIYSL